MQVMSRTDEEEDRQRRRARARDDDESRRENSSRARSWHVVVAPPVLAVPVAVVRTNQVVGVEISNQGCLLQFQSSARNDA
jgi:hypothetical protein